VLLRIIIVRLWPFCCWCPSPNIGVFKRNSPRGWNWRCPFRSTIVIATLTLIYVHYPPFPSLAKQTLMGEWDSLSLHICHSDPIEIWIEMPFPNHSHISHPSQRHGRISELPIRPLISWMDGLMLLLLQSVQPTLVHSSWLERMKESSQPPWLTGHPHFPQDPSTPQMPEFPQNFTHAKNSLLFQYEIKIKEEYRVTLLWLVRK
jgi:hypothetical protein